MSNTTKCPTCNGTGKVKNKDGIKVNCLTCRGTGQAPIEELIGY